MAPGGTVQSTVQKEVRLPELVSNPQQMNTAGYAQT